MTELSRAQVESRVYTLHGSLSLLDREQAARDLLAYDAALRAKLLDADRATNDWQQEARTLRARVEELKGDENTVKSFAWYEKGYWRFTKTVSEFCVLEESLKAKLAAVEGERDALLDRCRNVYAVVGHYDLPLDEAVTAQLATSEKEHLDAVRDRDSFKELAKDLRDQLAEARNDRDGHSSYLEQIKMLLDCHRAYIPETIEQLQKELATLRTSHQAMAEAVKPIVAMLTEVELALIGCSREQELAWKKAVKDLRQLVEVPDANT